MPSPPSRSQIPSASSRPGVELVGGDEDHLLRQRGFDRRAVHVDERDARAGDEFRHLGRRGLVDGMDNDRIDALGDEVLDLAELAPDVERRILEAQFDSVVAGVEVGHRLAQHGEKGVVEVRHRNPDLRGRCGRGDERGEKRAGAEVLDHDLPPDPIVEAAGPAPLQFCLLSVAPDVAR